MGKLFPTTDICVPPAPWLFLWMSGKGIYLSIFPGKPSRMDLGICLTRLALCNGMGMVTAVTYFICEDSQEGEETQWVARNAEGWSIMVAHSWHCILAFCLVLLEHILSNIIKPLFGGASRDILASTMKSQGTVASKLSGMTETLELEPQQRALERRRLMPSSLTSLYLHKVFSPVDYPNEAGCQCKCEECKLLSLSLPS